VSDWALRRRGAVDVNPAWALASAQEPMGGALAVAVTLPGRDTGEPILEEVEP